MWLVDYGSFSDFLLLRKKNVENKKGSFFSDPPVPFSLPPLPLIRSRQFQTVDSDSKNFHFCCYVAICSNMGLFFGHFTVKYTVNIVARSPRWTVTMHESERVSWYKAFKRVG
jgi:hypothetical protein